MSQCPAYWIAYILHPSYRGRWADRELVIKEYEEIIVKFIEIYEEDYANILTDDPLPNTSSQQAKIANND